MIKKLDFHFRIREKWIQFWRVFKVFLKWHLKNIILLCFIDLTWAYLWDRCTKHRLQRQKILKKITCIKIETKHPPNFEFPQHPQGHITNYRNSMLHFNHAFNRKTGLQLPPPRGQGAYCLLVWGHSWCNQPLKINSNQKHKLHYPNTGIGSSSFDTSILYYKPGNII